jgi:hypothetical protein
VTTCVILQPSYIPWVGVFQLMARADVYIHYDDVQYDKHGWRNRNRLRFPEGTRWITIPVSLPHGSLRTRIYEARIADAAWEPLHRRLIAESLGTATHFGELCAEVLPSLGHAERLTDVTIPLLEAIARLLDVRTTFLRSSELSVEGSSTDRLVKICEKVAASTYLTGPAARGYLDESLFDRVGIEVQWMDYPIRPYRQLHGDFDPHVSVLDPIANLGLAATRGLLENIP